eukprot:m.10985 g.10985  ORF g.10985 m.10985 type:complete len:630 (-) comp2799_c0_seq1:16-1905(-)
MADASPGGSYWSANARVPVKPIFSIKGEQKKVPEEHSAQEIADGIAKLAPTLRTAELSGNTFSLDACETFAKALTNCKNLECFLCDDAFTGRLKTMIHPALGLLAQGLMGSRLTVLDLSDNAVNPQGAERIAPLLTRCMTLKELYLNNTGVGPAGGKIIGDALLEASRAGGAQYGLHRFVLGRSRLESEGAIALADAFASMGTLIEVRMFQNGIPPPAAEKLATGLAANANLEVVDVSDNRLKLQGSVAMANALRSWRNLRVLNLSDNLVRHRGGMAVATALAADLPALRVIDVSGNDLTPEVGIQLGKALKGKAALEDVRLNDNAFGDDVADQLEEDLARDGREVDVSGAFDLEEDDRAEQDADADDLAFVAAGGLTKSLPSTQPTPTGADGGDDTRTAIAAPSAKTSFGSSAKSPWGGKGLVGAGGSSGTGGGLFGGAQSKGASGSLFGTKTSSLFGGSATTSLGASASALSSGKNVGAATGDDMALLRQCFQDMLDVQEVRNGLWKLAKTYTGTPDQATLLKQLLTTPGVCDVVFNEMLVMLQLIQGDSLQSSHTTTQGQSALLKLIETAHRQQWLGPGMRDTFLTIVDPSLLKERGLDASGPFATTPSSGALVKELERVVQTMGR